MAKERRATSEGNARATAGLRTMKKRRGRRFTSLWICSGLILLSVSVHGSMSRPVPLPRLVSAPARCMELRGGGVNSVDGRYLHGGEDRDVVFVKKKAPAPPTEAQLAARRAARADGEPLPTMPNEVKNAIAKARAAKKMTQKQLAQAMNVQAVEIQKYEQGRQVPTNAVLAKMEKILGTKLPRIKKTAPNELEKGESHPALRGGPV